MSTSVESTSPGSTRTGAGPIAGAEPGKTGTPDRRGLSLLVLSLAQLMVVLDATVVNIALPSAQKALAFSDADRQWIVTGYALAFGSLLLLGGRLSDFFGRKRMFVIGTIGFALASALGGAATGFGLLLAARVLQGVFAAVLAPAALSLVTTTFTEPVERSRAFAVFGGISGAGGGIGLLLGGVLTEYASWRWCLYINLVIAAVALVGAAVALHEGERPVKPHLDLPGVYTSVLGLVGVVYGLAEAESAGWGSAQTLVPLLAGLALLVGFVVIERRVEHPLLPLRVVLNRTRGGAYLTLAISGVGMFGLFLFLTYYLTATLGFSPVETGAAFLPMLGMVMLSAIVLGSLLVPKVGPRPLVPAGALLTAIGMALLTRLDLDSRYVADVLPALLIIGVGLGLVFAPAQNAATAGVAPTDAGVASAMINTAQQIGGSIGTALLSTFAASSASSFLGSRTPTPELLAAASVHSYHTVFWWSAAFLAACAVLAAVLFPSGPMKTDPDAPPVLAH